MRKHRPKATTDQATLIDRVIGEALHEDRALLDSLSDHERRFVVDWFTEAVLDGAEETALSKVVWEIDFKRAPVDIETFIKDPYYLGRTCGELDANWVRDLKEVFKPGSLCVEWLFGGCVGSGKTTTSMAAMVYKLYCMSLLRNPAKYYGLLAESKIVFGIYSITMTQVADTGYYRFKTYVDHSKYFAQEFQRNTKLESRLEFLNSPISVISGSRSFHTLGQDVFSFALDESNFMGVKEDKEAGVLKGQAYDIYNSAHVRITSRFMRKGGFIPGIMLLMSSRSIPADFIDYRAAKATNGRWKQGMRGWLGDETYMSDYAQWEIRRHRFSTKMFKVEVGDRVLPSRILKKGDEPRRAARIVQVPIDFFKLFSADIEKSLRDLAGVAVANVLPFIRDGRAVLDAAKSGLRNPFTKEEVSISTEHSGTIQDYFDVKKVCRVEHGVWVPRVNPSRWRYMHIDLGVTGDSAGLAMCHAGGVVGTEETRPDGTQNIERRPIVVFDAMLRIRPPHRGRIDFSKIRSFVFFLRSLYPIKVVTFDGFQSEDMTQLLRKESIESRVLSLDREDKQYVSFRSAFMERRISMYSYMPFVNEVLDLYHDIRKKKVDHPMVGSNGLPGAKDVSDAAAGSFWNCFSDPDAVVDAAVDVRTTSAGVENVVEIQRRVGAVGSNSRYDWDKLAKAAESVT